MQRSRGQKRRARFLSTRVIAVTSLVALFAARSRLSISFEREDRRMRDDEIFSHAAMLRNEKLGLWRLAPFITALILLLGTMALGMMLGEPSGRMRATAERIDVAGSPQR